MAKVEVPSIKTTNYNPTTKVGPLSNIINPTTGLIDNIESQKVLNSFRSGTYSEVANNSPITLYRNYSNPENMLGTYWTKTPPSGPTQSIIDNALLPQWGNNATSVVKIELPANIKYYEGVAAPQGGLTGGGNQIYIPQTTVIKQDWIK